MRKGKRNDELAYFCSGIPVTRARAQELRSSPSREDPLQPLPLQMPSSPIILRSGRTLRSPTPVSKVDPQQDPVCQLLSQILNKHRKPLLPEEDPLNLQLQQILKPLSARASTSADVNPPWPQSALLGSPINANAQQPKRQSPAKTGSSKFQIAGPPPKNPKFSRLKAAKPKGSPPPRAIPSPPRAVYSPVAKHRGPSPPRAKLSVPSDARNSQQTTTSAQIIQACSLLLSDVLGKVESAMGAVYRPKSANVPPKTPPRPDQVNKQTKAVTVVSKPVKYVDRGTSTVELIDLTPSDTPTESIGDPGFRFHSVDSKSIHSPTCTVEPLPRHIKTEPFAGWEEEPSHIHVPVRTRSFRPQVPPSPPRRATHRGRVISVPCSIL